MRAAVVSLICFGALAGCATQPMQPSDLKGDFAAARTAQECQTAALDELSRARQSAQPTYVGSRNEVIGTAIGNGIAMGIIKSRTKRHLALCFEKVGATEAEVAALIQRGNARNESVSHTEMGLGRCPKNAPVMYGGSQICLGN